ncbi:mobile mystery protein A [bacterium]|nr:MAG: mobile mystery protein A [bacterium]
MDRMNRSLRRRQLDRLLFSHPIFPEEAPQEGWLRTFRESLGMSLEAFGNRLGISRQSAQSLEKGEVSGSITLRKLREAADALECDVRVVMVPRRPLEEQILARAEDVVRERLERVGHSMALEAQAIDGAMMQAVIEQKAREMVEKGDPRIWSS